MNKFKNFLIKVKDKFLDLIFPNDIKCIFCETDILDFDKKPYCEKCEKSHILNDGNRCMFCDVQILDGNKVCDFCASTHKDFEKAVCPFVYKNQVRSAILNLKENNARWIVPTFAKLMCQRLKEENIDFDYIIPVPVHEKTRKRRGYNQSKLLADEIAKIMNKPVADDLIIKFKLTKSQKELNYTERQKNLEGSFTLTDKNFVKGKSFLIVDDVITTCATVNTCAKILKKAKSKAVYVTAIARNPLKK